LDPGSGGLTGVGLAPLAVCPSHQHKGIGSALVREGLLACRKRGLGFVVVLGEPAYYKRFGFIRADDRGLRNEFGATGEFMLLDFQLGTLALAGGLVKYAPEFAVAFGQR
jgi:putative acetyltransferase